ncbi:MAG: hypothetical protein R2695_18935 [Acidimicrobiales bacterium]
MTGSRSTVPSPAAPRTRSPFREADRRLRPDPRCAPAGHVPHRRRQPFLDQQEGELLLTLDPLAERQAMAVLLRNHDEVRVRAFAVTPADWRDATLFTEWLYSDQGLPEPTWPEIYDAWCPPVRPPTSASRPGSTSIPSSVAGRAWRS